MAKEEKKKEKKKDEHVTSLDISKKLNDELEKVMEEHGNSKAWHVRKALKIYLKNLKSEEGD